MFSTKCDAPPLISLGRRFDERYFGLHHDLSPEEIAIRLNGKLVWKGEDDGMWVGLIRCNRQFEARLER